MKNEFTHLVLVSPLWLLTGLLLYFILSLFKVHIIWQIQAKIYNNPNNEPLFKDYFNSFFKSLFSGASLTRGTFKYLFRYKEKDFPIIKDDSTKPIKRRLNILNGLTTFLKPYLIFATIWALLVFWISKRFFYDPTTITFGHIQQFLTELEHIPFVSWLQKNKSIVFLLYGIICLAIPYLYEHEAGTKKVKKYFTQTLIYLSLLANISFFGVQTGKITASKHADLSQLRTEITKIHDSIYREIVVAIEVRSLIDVIQYEDSLYNGQIKQFDSLTWAINKLPLDTASKLELYGTLQRYKEELKKKATVEGSQVELPSDAKPEGSSLFSEVFNHSSSDNSTSSYADYMTNRSVWNKETGQRILSEAKTVVKESAVTKSQLYKKLEKLLGYFFDYGSGMAMSGALDAIGLKEQATLKKIVSLFALPENFKDAVVAKAIKLVKKITNKTAIVPNDFMVTDVPFKGATADELKSFSEENRNYLIEEENKQLEASLKKKIASLNIVIPSESETIAIINANMGNGTVSTEAEAMEILERYSDYKFDTDLGLSENIKNIERNAYFDIFKKKYGAGNGYEYNSYLKDYNRLLGGSASNLSFIDVVSITDFIGPCDGKSTICIKCGLPCAFPFCLVP